MAELEQPSGSVKVIPHTEKHKLESSGATKDSKLITSRLCLRKRGWEVGEGAG